MFVHLTGSFLDVGYWPSSALRALFGIFSLNTGDIFTELCM